MSALFVFLSIVYIIVCVSLITVVLLQKKRTAGIGAGTAGMGAHQTYWDRNKGRSLEGALERYTKILGTIFIILSLILTVVR